MFRGRGQEDRPLALEIEHRPDTREAVVVNEECRLRGAVGVTRKLQIGLDRLEHAKRRTREPLHEEIVEAHGDGDLSLVEAKAHSPPG